MKPTSDLTTPRRLIAPMSRHFFPVEQPEPFCCTTGLKNGSRLPVIAHFFSFAFSSGLGCLGSTAFLAEADSGAPTTGETLLAAGTATLGAEAAILAGDSTLACSMGSGLEAVAFAAEAFTSATFGARMADLAVAVGGVAAVAAFPARAELEALTGAGLETFSGGAGLLFATLGAAPCECKVKITLPAEPGVNS